MKKIALMLMMAVAVLMATSCKENLTKRFDNFVNKVENNCANYTEDDWTKANGQFEQMIQEFQENKDSFTEEQQKQIRTDAAKYVGLVAKSGIETVTNAVNSAVQGIPALIDGANEFFKTLGVELNNAAGEVENAVKDAAEEASQAAANAVEELKK